MYTKKWCKSCENCRGHHPQPLILDGIYTFNYIRGMRLWNGRVPFISPLFVCKRHLGVFLLLLLGAKTGSRQVEPRYKPTPIGICWNVWNVGSKRRKNLSSTEKEAENQLCFTVKASVLHRDQIGNNLKGLTFKNLEDGTCNAVLVKLFANLCASILSHLLKIKWLKTIKRVIGIDISAWHCHSLL